MNPTTTSASAGGTLRRPQTCTSSTGTAVVRLRILADFLEDRGQADLAIAAAHIAELVAANGG